MIKIRDISIENFRSIVGVPLSFTLENYSVVVGPNNSGKSNILRALQLFFNNQVDGNPYNAAVDFPKSNTLSNRAQTEITVALKYDPTKDVRLEKAIKQLEQESGQVRLGNNLLRLRLEYTRKNTYQWRFFSKAGLRNIKADLVLPIVQSIRSSVRFKYLPVGRNTQEAIKNELSEELIRTIFSGWSGAVQARQDIDESITTLIERLQPRLSNSGKEITEAIGSVFHEIKKLELRLPFADLETMLPSLIPSLRDNYETPLNQKGAGIQTSTLLFILKYLADHHPQRHNKRITYIWAIEEPESYLHPSRQRGMASILQKFSEDVQTIVTTHSPHFVPKGSNSRVFIVDNNDSPPYSTQIVGNDYDMARQALGVSLLDSMYLYKYNLIVEGASDEILLRGAWQKLFSENRIQIDPVDIRIFPGNNANGACNLYESFINYGSTSDVYVGLILDGDDAGAKALNGLMSRNKDNFKMHANKDYFQLEMTMEWLTSVRVMEELKTEFPSQVTINYNTSEEITNFTITETKKKKIANGIVKKSTIDDLTDFQKLAEKIEKAILDKFGSLNNQENMT